MKTHRFSLGARIRSFGFALNGLKIMAVKEHNFRINIIAALCAIGAGGILKISAMEWVAILFAIGMVMALETINSAIERICDFVSPAKEDKIGIIKDLAASAVLIGAITAFIIGLIIFVPKLM